ncbi:MAG: 2,3,4,5-tetrahydropyridine-2,6-dicarboxylate N-succinyltransferase [Legionellales bacterium]|nr:2,3,4,5-tetrahydropyridine-2,6-dicarboxylate N-succinyltransferase [Legionellales bacterium]
MQDIIEHYFEERHTLKHDNTPPELREAIEETLSLLDKGKLRVATPVKNQWIVDQSLKKTILLAFRLYPNHVMSMGETSVCFDKIPLKYQKISKKKFRQQHARIVPGAIIRYGAYIGQSTVVMPSFVNIGAYIDDGAMIDTWATVGSCAQIGKNVHLSGGVGIGGVLEPLQANPTIIEDNCFIGARSEVVEGVIVEKNSVLSMGVFIGQSTKIYNRMTGEISYGRVPSGSVVVPGSLPSKDVNLYCAVIVKQIDEQTRSKTRINELLRDID